MVEVIISADGQAPKGRKNLTKHDKTRQRPRSGWKTPRNGAKTRIIAIL
jgi:hypothetical protein